MKKQLRNRIKATVLSLTMAAAMVPVCSAPVNAVSVPDSASITVSKGLSQTMDDTSVYKGTIPEDGADSVTFTLDTNYAGQSFSYGFGCSTAEKPYWLELDKSGEWMEGGAGSKVEGTACKLDKASSTITIDLSEIDAKPGGTFEFRCYYSAHWDNSKKDMVANTVKLTGVDFSSGSSSSSSSTPETKNKKSGTWSFKDNKDGTATISATISKQLDELDYELTVGYDDEYYEKEGIVPEEGDPINSHKFKYSDFGIPSDGNVTIESLLVTVESDYDIDKFMYGCGTNVEKGSAADTEYAKAQVSGKANAGYWYNEMGAEVKEELEADGVEFGIDEIGEGTTLEGAGKYIQCLWDVPDEVQKCQTTRPSDSIGFQFWYGTKDASKYTEITSKDPVKITSAAITYTVTKTIPYSGSTKNSQSKTLDCTATADSKKNFEISYEDLGITADMRPYAIRFDVSADKPINKLVYGTGTGTTSKSSKYWYQEPVNSAIIGAEDKVEIMWILPDSIAGATPDKSIVNPEGNVVFGYYYGESDTITIDNVEVYYAEVPTEPTTEELKPTLLGDANCDGSVDMSDVVMVMQCTLNPKKYDVDGASDDHITEIGKINGDVDGKAGLTPNDALIIQRFTLKLIEDFS